MYNSTDIELIVDSKNGDKYAMELLIRRHQKAVYNAAYRLVGNPDDAAEIAQQSFLKMMEKLDQYDSNFKFFSWIYRITINEAINFLRKKNTQHLEPETLESVSPGPAESLGQLEVQEKVQKALMNLKDDYRSVIVLKHFVGCNYQDIGEILQIPVGKVRSRLFTARQLMKEHLHNTGAYTG